ncbi:MAG: maltose alpha-D-glucosyltransferase [Polyangiaceae bacterium]|nr:maltose alpha-D-glucosyltransferase [Polyangiaceae bacterium]
MKLAPQLRARNALKVEPGVGKVDGMPRSVYPSTRPPPPRSPRRTDRREAGGLDGDPLWYKDAIIYEVRTRSFFDSNSDGIGDLRGLTSKLDYLADLGITAVWLLPHYPSPGLDDGYDIADYTDIHSEVGTLEDFDELVENAHKRGIRIITELVINHTSDAHPWFQRARRAPSGSLERDFYVWSDSADRYADARIIFRDFELSNWTWDRVAKAYFWHRFFSHQPDLNFENPAVHEAVFGVVDFWLARGVDGLRLDAVPYLYEEEGTNCENLKQTHDFLKKLRAHVDSKWTGRMLLAEANQWPEDAAKYFGDGDECHMNFHFPIMPRLFMSMHMEDRFPIIDILRQTPELHPNCQWAMFLRNHDELTLEMVTDEERDYMYRAYAHESQMRINLGIRRRLAPLAGNDRRKMELLNGLLFSMPGTPVLYYGDEIGMGDNVYLGDRNGVRTPMQWSADRNAGFSRANPQRLILPINIDPEYHYEAMNVEAQQSNANSLLWWTKRLIALRKRYQAFGRGTVRFLHPSNPRVLAFVREYDDETILVVANLSRHMQVVELELEDMKGRSPVEIMGGARLPPIGDGSYMLTIGGHNFYWLSIEPFEPSEEERLSLRGAVTLSCTSLHDVLFGAERSRLAEALEAFIEARGWTESTISNALVLDSIRVGTALNADNPDGPPSPVVLFFTRIEYAKGGSEVFAMPLVAVSIGGSGVPSQTPAPGTVVAQLYVQADRSSVLLLEATSSSASRVLFDAIAKGATIRSAHGKITCGSLPGVSHEHDAAAHRVIASDRLGAVIAFGTSYVLKLFYRMEEATAPELEVGRLLRNPPPTSGPLLVPRVLGQIEYVRSRGEPVTLGVLENYVLHEGTAWEHALSEIGRAYERVLARPVDGPPPAAPTTPLLELAYLDPPEEHRELVGTYRDWATLLGRRIADLHMTLVKVPDPSFEPRAVSTLDQRSRYQSARNLIGRVLAMLRRVQRDLPPAARKDAAHLIANEEGILAQLEPLLTQRIDSKQIRYHGNLHLARAMFTGKDFVMIGSGGGRERRVTERRRRGSALHDVASMVRSLHYAAATALDALRPKDQAGAVEWCNIWHRWTSAALLRGYLDTAGDQPFVPQIPAILSMMLDTAVLERAFVELRHELRRQSNRAWIPLQGIVRLLNHA